MEEVNQIIPIYPFINLIITGNGPSGICLSYMLAGNWPYYTGEPHPVDDMLTARLRYSATKSLNEDCDDAGNDVNTDATTNNRRKSCKSGKTQGVGLARSTRYKLESLSSGIEGRGGGRPLALLMDQLHHPSVDTGMDVASLLYWRSADEHPDHKVVDHVVLGKGQPGGAWQVSGANVMVHFVKRWFLLCGMKLYRDIKEHTYMFTL